NSDHCSVDTKEDRQFQCPLVLRYPWSGRAVNFATDRVPHQDVQPRQGQQVCRDTATEPAANHDHIDFVAARRALMVSREPARAHSTDWSRARLRAHTEDASKAHLLSTGAVSTVLSIGCCSRP